MSEDTNDTNEVVPKKQNQVRAFFLERIEDESGVSGTGIVAVGCELPTGRAVLEWLTVHSSVCIYNNINDVANIHSHGGKTRVIWGYPDEEIKKVKRKARKRAK